MQRHVNMPPVLEVPGDVCFPVGGVPGARAWDPNARILTLPDTNLPGEDLFRAGNDHCVHEFSPWDSTSGVFKIDDTTIAWWKVESNCRHCDARIGRKVQLTTEDLATS